MAGEKHGQIGDLTKKSLPELQELLERQEKLLAKPKFLETLSDKGEKVKHFVQSLREIIAKRTGSSHLSGDCTSGIRSEIHISNTSNSQSHSSQTVESQNRSPQKLSEFGKLRDTFQDSNIKVGRFGQGPAPDKDVAECSKQEVTHAEGDAQANDAATELSKHLQSLVVTEDSHHHTSDGGSHSSVILNDGMDNETRFLNSYERVIKRSMDKESNPKPKFKTNSTLKISSISDLPDEFRQKAQVSDASTDETHHADLKVTDNITQGDGSEAKRKPVLESAVHPPSYQFQMTKMISVEESLALQRHQREDMERLQAEHAAQRLAERMHIKMEEYVPEEHLLYREREVTEDDETYENDDEGDDSMF